VDICRADADENWVRTTANWQRPCWKPPA